MLAFFGFSTKLREWILEIFSSCHICLLLNGKPACYFACSQGVRHGDPLSPLLFCLAEEFLSRSLTRLVYEGTFLAMRHNSSSSFPSHFLYVDDAVIFGSAIYKNFKALKFLFDDYTLQSGQAINWGTTAVFFRKWVSPLRVRQLSSLLGVRV